METNESKHGNIYCSFIGEQPVNIEALKQFLFGDTPTQIIFSDTVKRANYYHTTVEFWPNPVPPID